MRPTLTSCQRRQSKDLGIADCMGYPVQLHRDNGKLGHLKALVLVLVANPIEAGQLGGFQAPFARKFEERTGS